MEAQQVTVHIGEDRQSPQNTLVLIRIRRAKNLERSMPPKASQRSKWKVCKGGKCLDLFFTTVFHLFVR